MKRKLYVISAALLALSTGVLAAPATASDTDASSIVVHYTAAELGNPEGARRIYEHIVSSAEALCASLDGASLDRKARFGSCRRSTIDRAVAALDAPRVTALNEGRSAAAIAFANR